MKRYNKNLGDFGEDVAQRFLEDKGYKILERNYHTRMGEIDIIAMDKDILVFAEVKTRSSNMWGQPAEAVDRQKLAHIYCAGEKYLEQNPFDGNVRIDVVEVYAVYTDGVPEYSEINHIEDIIN